MHEKIKPVCCIHTNSAPKIHFILPHKCGSGKNGANPSVAQSSKGINKSFRLHMMII